MDKIELIRKLIDLVEKERFKFVCENFLKELGFLSTPTSTGSILIQHSLIPIRGEVIFSIMSSRIGDIHLECDKSLYNEYKLLVKSFSNFQYKKLMGGAIDIQTGVSLIFSNNIFEGRKIIIHKTKR